MIDAEGLDQLSQKKFAENEAAFEETCRRGHMTGDEAHAFACGWDWAFETIKQLLVLREDS